MLPSCQQQYKVLARLIAKPGDVLQVPVVVSLHIPARHEIRIGLATFDKFPQEPHRVSVDAQLSLGFPQTRSRSHPHEAPAYWAAIRSAKGCNILRSVEAFRGIACRVCRLGSSIVLSVSGILRPTFA